MIELTKLKTKMAKAHEKTRELTNAFLALGETIGSCDIDDAITPQIREQFRNCRELNHEIRKLVEVKK